MEVAAQVVGVAVVPLNVRVLVPCDDPKLVPVIVINACTAPELGDKLVILGLVTVNITPLLATPETVTITLPVVDPLGTVTWIDVEDQLVAVADVPLNATVLVPWVDPKFVPVIVTGVPIRPEDTERLAICGVGKTVKLMPLLLTPLAKTTTLPLVAPLGTVTAIELADQLLTLAAVPLNETVPVPWLLPKLLPEIVTGAPTPPEVTDKLVMLGAGTTVNAMVFVVTPLARTNTFPLVAPVGIVITIEVADQLVILAAVTFTAT
jgi:hypothetical protein